MYSEKARELIRRLEKKGLYIAVAESCTGGKLSDAIVSVPGASKVFKEGFVTYSNSAKIKTLQVDAEVINKKGAISGETAELMARGAALNSGADIGLSTTGNAGPAGDEGKPVGLVYIGFFKDGKTGFGEFRFEGDREAVRSAAALKALEYISEVLDTE